MTGLIKESKITKKGQITIPKEFRKRLGLKIGDKVIFEFYKDGILLRKKENIDITKIIKDVAGIWKNHPLFANKTTKEIIGMLRGPDDETS